MKLHAIDIAFIVAYLIIMVMIGWYYRKKARQNKESYLLGGKRLPWYLLGLSDASDMFDISGTMWMVALCFVYGFKSIWIPWLWPVFNQVFNMMYLSKWLRRSNANTGAEWLATRFGLKGKGVTASHNVVVAFALIGCLGFLAYGFVGLGKFIEIFVPWKVMQPYIPFHVAPEYVAHFYGIVFTLFAMFYSILGGMHSIVIGDFIKYLIMTVGCFAIGIIAYTHLQGKTLNTPHNWSDPFFGWNLNLNWSHIIADVNKKITEDGFSPFGFFFMMMLFKGALASLAGPAPNYDMQKILSTRSPKDASKMTGFVSLILLPIRYTMIIGLTVLALLYYNGLDLSNGTGGTDFERILPGAINNFLPAGILGLVLTGLLGAFMGTFSGTLNAAQAYIVNDIYLKYINPTASNRRIISMNYIVGVVVVAIGVTLGFFAKDVNSILQWIVGALYGGYIAANMLKWYWWRFNAHGFFWGMMAGIAAALVFPFIFTGLPLYNWPLLFLISLIGSIVGTYTAPPTDNNVLKKFYITVRPWGFWKPVHEEVMKENPSFQPNKRFKLDMFNVVLGIIAQCCLTILPMYLVLSMKLPLLVTIAILLAIIFVLKKTWWNKLDEGEDEITNQPQGDKKENMNTAFDKRLIALEKEHEALVSRKNVKEELGNGVYDRYKSPVLTAGHAPLFWRYDIDPKTNPFLMERFGINAAFNAGAIKLNDKYYLVARVEGADRKSFFAVAESPNGIDNFRFWDYPVQLPSTDEVDTNVYDMRLVQHEDGWIYGLFCTERKDPAAPVGDEFSAIAQCGIVRTKDLLHWERLADLKTKSPQQRNVVLHPEFVQGKYAFYTRPQDGFINTGKGGGIGFGLSYSIENAVVDEEVVIDPKVYHTVYEAKNGQGPAPIKTEKGWLHLAHGVRNTAAGLRYTLYMFMTDLHDLTKIIYKPAGYFMAPEGEERIGDVSNVVFSNGWIADDDGTVYIYYASSDTRMHVATSSLERLLDYCINTPADGFTSAASVQTIFSIIDKNKKANISEKEGAKSFVSA